MFPVHLNLHLFPERPCEDDRPYAGHGLYVTDIYGRFISAFLPDR